MSEIPAEILSKILEFELQKVDHLHCSLVCNQWLLTTRRTKHFEQACLTRDNFDTFASLVINPLSTFRECIRHVILDLDSIWLRRSLPILQLLENITKVETRNLDWTQSGATDYVREQFIATICPTVRSLTFGKGTKFSAFTEAVGMACRMQGLEQLHFDAVDWSTIYLSNESPSFTLLLPSARSTVLPLYITLPKSCHRMSARSCRTRDIFQWLISHQPFPTLRRLSFEFDPENMTYMCSFFTVAGDALEWLDLSVDFSRQNDILSTLEYFYPDSLSPIEVGTGWHKSCITYGPLRASIVGRSSTELDGHKAFNRLHTFRLDNFVYYTDLSRSSAANFGINILQLLCKKPRSAPLERVIFVIVLDRVADLGLYTFSWPLLDRLLIALVGSNDGVCHVGGRRVVFEIGGAVDLDSLSFQIRSKLELCESRSFIDIRSLPKAGNLVV